VNALTTWQHDLDQATLTLPAAPKRRRLRPTVFALLRCPGCGHHMHISDSADPDGYLESHTTSTCLHPHPVIVLRIAERRQAKEDARRARRGEGPDPKKGYHKQDTPWTREGHE
jgi:hypothetical protein